MKRSVFAMACLALIAFTGMENGNRRVYLWTADPMHSSIVFETGHWGVVDIVGWFEEYEITVRSSELDFSDAEVEVRINPGSVRMPNPAMAANLRNQFFEIEEYPEIRFHSTKIDTTAEADVFELTGVLTMKTVAKETVFSVRFNGYGTPPQGSPGFKAEGLLDRVNYGVGDLKLMKDTNRPLVDAEVRITCNIRLDYLRSEYER